MSKSKFVILALLLILVLIGTGYFVFSKSFYKKICKRVVPFQEKLDDFYGSSGANFSYYNNINECIEESLKKEEETYKGCLYQKCLKEKNEDDCNNIEKDKGREGLEKFVDPKECQEIIDEKRKSMAEIYTKGGCEDGYGTECLAYKPSIETSKYLSSEESSEIEDQYNDCMDDIIKLCEDLPEKF